MSSIWKDIGTVQPADGQHVWLHRVGSGVALEAHWEAATLQFNLTLPTRTLDWFWVRNWRPF